MTNASISPNANQQQNLNQNSETATDGETRTGVKRRPSRNQSLPATSDDHTLDYAACRPELQGKTPGEYVQIALRLKAFESIVQPKLDAINAKRAEAIPGERGRRGPRAVYHAEDFFILKLLRRVVGAKTTKATRDWLTEDRADSTRHQLGFDIERPHVGGKQRLLMSGIPSDPWMSTFSKKYLSDEQLEALLEEFEYEALMEKIEKVPGAYEETFAVNIDGSKYETCGTPPKRRKKEDGSVVTNAGHVTAPDAGYIPDKGYNANHSGAGWNPLLFTGSKGTVYLHHRVPMHYSEGKELGKAAAKLGQLFEDIDLRFGPQGVSKVVRIATADSAFNCKEARLGLRAIKVLENIQISSHGHGDKTKAAAERRDDRELEIEGYPNWKVNGHREFCCKCGLGKVSRLIGCSKRHGTVARVRGECKNCGTITITSGLWWLSGNTFKKISKHKRELKTRQKRTGKAIEPDFSFGHPLTYHDEISREYGTARFANQEGLFGSQFTNRFGILEGKRRVYRGVQVDIDFCFTVIIMHALAIEHHRLAQSADRSPPIPTLTA